MMIFYIALIFHMLLYTIPFALLSVITSMPIFFIIKKRKSNKYAWVSAFFIATIIFISSIICYIIFSPVDYHFRITNFSDKNIIIENIYLDNKLLFEGEYVLLPSNREGEWLGDNAIQLDVLRIIPFKKKYFKIFFRDEDDKKNNETIEISDNKKRGCFFYFIYNEEEVFSWKCIKFFVDD